MNDPRENHRSVRRTVLGSFSIRVLTSLVSVALALIGLEAVLPLGLRYFAELESADLVQGHFPQLYDYHQRLGWIPKPHATGFKWDVPVLTGEEGIRLNGHPLDPRKMQSQILVVGDSFTFGDEVGDADTWPAQLETLLHERMPAERYQVLNAGVSSYGFDQTLLRAEELVPKYRPQLLIVGFIQEDFERCLQSIRHGVPKPYFILTPDGLELRNVPTPAPSTPSHYREFLLRHSSVVSVLARRGPLGVRSFLTAGTMREIKQDDSRSATDIVAKLVTRLLALKQAYDFRLVILAQPNAVDQTLDPSTQAVLDSLRHSSDETLAVVDAVDAIRAHASTYSQQRRPFYYSKKEYHMTPAGNQFIAETVLPFVLTLLGETSLSQ